jgi:hypothetical protein
VSLRSTRRACYGTCSGKARTYRARDWSHRTDPPRNHIPLYYSIGVAELREFAGGSAAYTCVPARYGDVEIPFSPEAIHLARLFLTRVLGKEP